MACLSLGLSILLLSSDIAQITKFLLYCLPSSLLLRRGCQYSLCVSIMLLFLLMFCFQCVGANVTKAKVVHIICFLFFLFFLLLLCFQCVGADVSKPKVIWIIRFFLLFLFSSLLCFQCVGANISKPKVIWIIHFFLLFLFMLFLCFHVLGLMSPNLKSSGSFIMAEWSGSNNNTTKKNEGMNEVMWVDGS